jgi:hypothetical protein
MTSSAISRIAGITVAAVMLAACGGSGNSAAVPGAETGTQGVSSRIGETTGPNLSGEYSGPIKDNKLGKGTGLAFYAEYGNAVGGAFELKFKTQTFSIFPAQEVHGSTVDGTADAGSGSDYCTSSMKSTYDAKTNVLKGSYATVYGCTGEKGTFALKHLCYFKGSGGADIRPEAGVKAC